LSHGTAAAIPQWGKIWLSVHLHTSFVSWESCFGTLLPDKKNDAQIPVATIEYIYKLLFTNKEWTNSRFLSFQLKVIGLYDWTGNNSIIPELWLVPYSLPIHPGTFLVSWNNYN
jgi:hypothetical protein